MSPIRSILLALPLATLLAPSAGAQAGFGAGPSRMNDFLIAELDLTEEQAAEVRPILDDHAAALRAIRAQRADEELSRFGAVRELRAAGKTRDEKLKPLLSEEQWETYAALQEEFRASARERLKNRDRTGARARE